VKAVAFNRSLEFAWLSLAGIPGYAWCGTHHICAHGHLFHDPPGWYLYCDFLWVAAFVGAALAVLRSDARVRVVLFSMLLLLVVSRFLMGSGGGTHDLIEFPLLMYLALRAVLTISRVRRHGSQEKMGPQPQQPA
jgi:hypothetical protein